MVSLPLLRSFYMSTLTLSVENDSHDEAIDTQNTRHDNGDDWLEDKIRLQHTHAADANTWLSSTVGSTQI